MLPRRINTLMPIYRDCTMGELLMLFFISVIGWLVVSILLASLFFGHPLLGACIGFPLSFFTVPLLAKQLQAQKIGKPAGYYQLAFRLTLEDKGMISTPFLRRCGAWSLERNNYV